AASMTLPRVPLPHDCRCSAHGGPLRLPPVHPAEPERGLRPQAATPRATPASAAIRSTIQPHAPPQSSAPAVPFPATAPCRTPHGRRASPPPSATTAPSAGTRRSPPKASRLPAEDAPPTT